MAVVSEGKRVKLRIQYDKGSQTFSQCDSLAGDGALYNVATAIASLRKDENVEITKITEAQLVEE